MISLLLPLTLLVTANPGGSSEFEIKVLGQNGSSLNLLLVNPSDDLAILVVQDGAEEYRSRIPAKAEHRHTHSVAARGLPLSLRSIRLSIEVDGVEQIRLDTDVIDPVILPDESLLSLRGEEIDDLRARWQQDPRVAAILDRLVRRADNRANRHAVVPNTGGAWTQLYRCPDTGVMLEMVNYHLHRSPATGKTYSGYPYDHCVTSFRHKGLGNQAYELALSYRLTDDLRYAQRSRDLLVEYAMRYPGYLLHDRNGATGSMAGKAFAQTLDEAVWLIDLARAFDLLRGSSVLDASDELLIREGLLQTGVDLLQDNELGVHNIQNWHNAAILLAGIQCGDLAAARNAVFGPSGLEAQLAGGVDNDGFWFEGSPAYHFFTVQAMLHAVQPLSRAGIDADWSPMNAMFASALELIQPDSSLPMLNDGGRIEFYSLTDEYEEAMVFFSTNPRIDDLITVFGRSQELNSVLYGPEDDPGEDWQDVKSVNFAQAGIGALRAGPYYQRSMAVLDYGPHGGHHGHRDKLGLTLWMQGSKSLREAGADGYGTAVSGEFFPSTLAHSTVVVDGLDQQESRGALGYFVRDADGSTLTASADAAYPGVAQRRLVHLTAEGHLADMFEVVANESRTFDYVLHGDGSATTSLTLSPLSAGFGGAYGHLSQVQGAQVDGDFEVTFVAEDGSESTVWVAGEPGTQVLLAVAPGFPIASSHPVLIVRRSGTRAVFASAVTEGASLATGVVLSLEDDGSDPELHLSRPGVEGKTILKY